MDTPDVEAEDPRVRQSEVRRYWEANKVVLFTVFLIIFGTGLIVYGTFQGGAALHAHYHAKDNATGFFGTAKAGTSNTHLGPPHVAFAPVVVSLPHPSHGFFGSPEPFISRRKVASMICETLNACNNGAAGDSPTPHTLKLVSLAGGVPATVFFITRCVNALFAMNHIHLEDWLMIPTFCFYVALVVFVNVSAKFATNLYAANEQALILADPVEVTHRILGSKIVIGLEQAMMLTSWSVKICIWSFVRRVGARIQKMKWPVTLTLWYIIGSYIVIEIAYFGVLCRPFSQYWALPVDNLQCATYQDYNTIQMYFNVSTDFILVALPLYIIFDSRVRWSRKLVLTFVFSTGILIVGAAIYNKWMNFANPLSTEYQVGYLVEASMAIVAGNFVQLYQLLNEIFKWSPPWGDHPPQAEIANENHRALLTRLSSVFIELYKRVRGIPAAPAPDSGDVDLELGSMNGVPRGRATDGQLTNSEVTGAEVTDGEVTIDETSNQEAIDEDEGQQSESSNPSVVAIPAPVYYLRERRLPDGSSIFYYPPGTPAFL